MNIPEIKALESRPSVIRIPHQIDIPVTSRVRRLIDSEPFRRLSRISQLGLVSLVYPGANHSRFEHSLGVFRNSLLFIRRLLQFEDFRGLCNQSDLEALIVASLLHDLGHWPYCHPIEDMDLANVPRHEDAAANYILNSEISGLVADEWSCDVDQVLRLIQSKPVGDTEKILCSILSGPIDIDKMDYLYRDSLHCGVPYGMNFDAPRLINSIGLNHQKNGIAISSKGKTAAEMMVFSRYVMFSEVYWHHAVRSATAMLQRVFYLWNRTVEFQNDFARLWEWDDRTIAHALKADSDLYSGLFGSTRRLYKRVLDFNANQHSEIFNSLAHQPYTTLSSIGGELAESLTQATGIAIGPNDVLIDAPPPGLEVQFKVEVYDDQTLDSLENISPVVNALAKQQFDHFVKRVRVFVNPRIYAEVKNQDIKNILISNLKTT